jgi:hypothetical protein
MVNTSFLVASLATLTPGRGVAAIDSTIDSSIVSNLTTTIDFFNSKGTISIVDAIKHVEKTNVMTKIIFKI